MDEKDNYTIVLSADQNFQKIKAIVQGQVRKLDWINNVNVQLAAKVIKTHN